MLKRIPLAQITRNPDQPRQHFDRKALGELADSIEQNGLMQPITVRPIEETPEGHQFMVIAGERRFRAHQILAERGVATDILAHVRRMDDRDMHINAILENLQRAEVSAMEEAVAYQRMIDGYGFTVPELAKRLGISQQWRITDRLALLGLTEDNRQLLAKGVVTLTQAYHMAQLSPNGQQEFLRMVRAGLATTNKAAEAAAAAIAAKEAQIGFDMPEPKANKPRASIRSTEERIDALGTALQPLFKDGAWRAPDNLDPAEAQRCIEKLKLVRQHIGQLERELQRAATIAAVA